jgi:hypothetical protein
MRHWNLQRRLDQMSKVFELSEYSRSIRIGTVDYQLTPAFCRGMKAARDNLTELDNPYIKTALKLQWKRGFLLQRRLIGASK